MPLTEESVRKILSSIAYPGFNRDVVALGAIREVRVAGDAVDVILEPGNTPLPALEELRSTIAARLAATPEIGAVKVMLPPPPGGAPSLNVIGQKKPSIAQRGSADPGLLPDVRHVVAVASGKGGVGKSTVAVNLAVALARQGQRVGLLDADVYGPSIPLMMGVTDDPVMDRNTRKLQPFEKFGVRFMSLGFLTPPDQAVIWRGPLVMKAIEQLLRDVDWGALDVLVVDMPPGTGDVQLTLSQRANLTGAVIVTTPQDVALADAIKGVAMFRKVEVPILGVIENMSFFVCPHCDGRSDIFGHGGARREAERQGVPFLGEVPLHGAIRAAGDDGTPVATGDSVEGQAFAAVADRVRESLSPDDAGGQEAGGGIFDRFRSIWGRDNPTSKP